MRSGRAQPQQSIAWSRCRMVIRFVSYSLRHPERADRVWDIDLRHLFQLQPVLPYPLEELHPTLIPPADHDPPPTRIGCDTPQMPPNASHKRLLRRFHITAIGRHGVQSQRVSLGGRRVAVGRDEQARTTRMEWREEEDLGGTELGSDRFVVRWKHRQPGDELRGSRGRGGDTVHCDVGGEFEEGVDVLS